MHQQTVHASVMGFSEEQISHYGVTIGLAAFIGFMPFSYALNTSEADLAAA